MTAGSPTRRLAGVAVIAFSSVAWWPAFTLGAWGTVFFPQVMSLWAVSTAAFILVELAPGKYAAPAWLATLVTLLGAPALVWILVRFAAPDLVEDAEPRDRVTVVAAVLVVVVGAFAVGTFQHEFFTCGDFTISGNSEPPGCTPGQPSLEILQR